MEQGNNLIGSVDELFKSQEALKRFILTVLKITGVLFIFILIVGFLVAVKEIPRPEMKNAEFNRSVYYDGSQRHKSVTAVRYLNESYLDESLAAYLKTGNQPDMNAFIKHLDKLLVGKLIVFIPSLNLKSWPKTEELIQDILKKNQQSRDSLMNVMRRRVFLDASGTSMIEKLNRTESGISTLRNYLRGLTAVCSGDFIEPRKEFSFQIGKVSSVTLTYPATLKIACSECAPLFDKGILAKAGVAGSLINEAALNQQALLLQKLTYEAEIKFKQKQRKERDSINKDTAEKRWEYRIDFYARWYTELLLFLDSLIFVLLLIRYWIIVRQKELPKKSTDFVYYATNRTSRFFRLIALIIITLGILKIIVGFFVSIFAGRNFLDSINLIPVKAGIFVTTLLDPPVTFVSTVLFTWFLILISEWVDFISNCYEVAFYKARETKFSAKENRGNENEVK